MNAQAPFDWHAREEEAKKLKAHIEEACEEAAKDFSRCVTGQMLADATSLEAELERVARMYLGAHIGALKAKVDRLEPENERMREGLAKIVEQDRNVLWSEGRFSGGSAPEPEGEEFGPFAVIARSALGLA